MSGSKVSSVAKKALVMALMLEGFCIVAGVAAFILTDNIMWIFIGVVAGFGFSAPALITFFKRSKENDRASG